MEMVITNQYHYYNTLMLQPQSYYFVNRLFEFFFGTGNT